MLKYFLTPHLKRQDLILKNIKGKTIIDFGSSEGELHKYLTENSSIGSKIISVDIAGKPDVRHDLNKFPYPFKSNYADTIVAGEIIEHLERPIDFLKECYRILKKKGRLVLTTPNMIGLQHLISRTDQWVVTRSDPHLYAWNVDMIVFLIKKIGFKIEKKIMLNVFWRRNLFYRFIAFCFPKIRPTIFIVAKK